MMKKTVLVLKPYSGIALTLAIILHGLLVAGFLVAPSPATFSATQYKGEYLAQIRVRFLAAPVIIQAVTESAATRPEPEQRPAATTAPRKQKVAQTAPESPPQTVPAPSSGITTAPAGNAFVSPFASIISQPLGRGSWGTSRPPAPSIDPAELQRQQVQLQLRTMLMDRLGNWVGWQTQQHTEVSCLIRLDLTTQQAKLSCTPAEKEAEVWSVLNGLLTAGSANGDGTLCLRIGTAQLSMTSCEVTP